MIGIVGGTFDPIHYGHLRPVHHIARQLDFRKTHYVLSARPPHREAPAASVGQRYEMLLLALQEYPGFVADDQEITRPGPSYTVWTLRNLRQRYLGEALCLVLGMDAYLGLRNWYRWQDVMALCNVVVLSRPGWSVDDLHQADRGRPPGADGGGVIWIADAPAVTVTATGLRERIAVGDDVSGELPPAVLAYIKQNEIYGMKRV